MGEVAFVLHTHLPHVRHHGAWPVGEEWLFQAWAEAWLPVTDVLLRLADEGHRDVLTLSVSPPDAHQLADDRLRREIGTWIGGQMWQADEQRGRYAGPHRDAVRGLAPFHWRHHRRVLDLHDRVESGGGVLATWRDLADRGVIELLAGPATHPYLPLTADPELVDAQLASGLAGHRRWAPEPDGLWLPECAYRPAGRVADPTAEPLHVDAHGTPALSRSGPERDGLETHLDRHGVTHTVVDAATFVRAAGGTDRDWTRRPEIPRVEDGDVYEVVHDGAWIGDSEVVAYARDLAVAYHVWSPTAGYPGDPWYRDFHARGGFGALPSWRVTDKSLPVEQKAPYEPAAAAARVRTHAEHFHGVLREVLLPRRDALVVAAYDTELFGHWWFEGATWLEGTLRRVAEDPALATTTLASRLERRPPTRRLALPESSWGYAKGHASWVSRQTRDLWRRLREAEVRFAREVRGRHSAQDEAAIQAARELAQAQASDWPFLINRGGSEGYARDRFDGHLERFHRLVDALGADGSMDLAVRSRHLADAPHDVSPFLPPAAREAVA